MTRICIYGAGSVGCYIGGRLLAAGADIRFVGRAAVGAALREHGLALSHYDGHRWSIPPAAIAFATDPAAAVDAENAALIARLRVSDEGQLGLTAFLDKRAADWSSAHPGQREE